MLRYVTEQNPHKPARKFVPVCAAVLAAVAIGGCSNAADEQPTGAAPAAESKPTSNNARAGASGADAGPDLAMLQQWGAQLNAARQASELIDFMDTHIASVEQETADAMLRDLFTFYRTDLQQLKEAYQRPLVQRVLVDLPLPISEQAMNDIAEEEVRTLLQTTVDGFYKLKAADGVAPMVDYSAFEIYDPYLSPDLQAYIALKAMESDNPAASDGTLIVPWDELAMRALAAEAYLKAYPGSEEYDEVKSLMSLYLSRYINGSSNTDPFEAGTYRIKNALKSSYMETVAASPDSIVGTIVAGYLEVLEASGWQVYEPQSEGTAQNIPEVHEFTQGLDAQLEKLLGSKSK
ncbi:hypothetical protein IDH44_11775 [Paenibacillus sp. IB182496]|uniref:Lipoprotein n=1 Tax=Paenibacillus sabuli TaxID=2772509 RepID=A0A927BT86_9BACL|nr:hypothetical protein [Paenibacillus sabuli]MBD2845872.1 hypothetical protein [Paenibacillus sabuli]